MPKARASVRPRSRIVPRDEIVFRGEMAGSMSSQQLKTYNVTVRKGTSRPFKAVVRAHNRHETYAIILKEHAQRHIDLYVYNVHRSLAWKSRSKDY